MTSLQQSEILTSEDSRVDSEPLPGPFAQEPDVGLVVKVRARTRSGDQEVHSPLGKVRDQAGGEDQEDYHRPRHVPDWRLRERSQLFYIRYYNAFMKVY